MNVEDSYQNILATQLAMNSETWAALKNHGVTEKTILRLEFFYYSSSESGAQKLLAFLREETDYDVDIQTESSREDQWLVAGRTQETSVSKEILDQWVEWMVAAGFDHECVLDGWGASV